MSRTGLEPNSVVGRELPWGSPHSARTIGLLTLMCVLGIGSMAFLFHRLTLVASADEQLFAREVRQQDVARQMQVAFKKQVQEWKDILLRGGDPEQFRHYTLAFFQQQHKTADLAKTLLSEVDPDTRQLVEAFLTQHHQLNEQYLKALRLVQPRPDRDFLTADRMVKGKDRGPTDLIDLIVGSVRRKLDAERSDIVASLRLFRAALRVATAFVLALLIILVRTAFHLQSAGQIVRENEELFRKAFLDSSVGMAILDSEGRFSTVNRALCESVGYEANELIGTEPWRLAAEDHQTASRHCVTELTSGRLESYVAERRCLRKDKAPIWLRVSASMLHRAGKPSESVILVENVTGSRRAKDELAYQAYHDILTGLPNRAHFELTLDNAIRQAAHNGQTLALLYLDLDGFKRVNDTCGHQVGDLLLTHVAKRLKSSLREADVLARVGGDEFTVLLTGLPNLESANRVAETLLSSFALPFPLADQEFFASASLGISLYPDDADDRVALLKRADAAMYEAKRAGKNGYRSFSSEMEQASRERLEIEGELRRALERNEIFVAFQPEFRVSGRRIARFETLCRWKSAERGLVSPATFIPIAEETGLIVPIGSWVLRQACEHAGQWQKRAGRGIPVAVNVSAVQFSRPDFVDNVRTTLLDTGLDGSLLELELTESVLMQDTEQSVRKMRELKELGVRWSIDDFGTGYSSLGYLQQMPIDGVKVDRSFVQSLDRSAAALSLIHSIVAMAHALELRVVVEGVETEGQLSQLATTGCDEVQGFLLGRPESPEAALARIDAERLAFTAKPALSAAREKPIEFQPDCLVA